MVMTKTAKQVLTSLDKGEYLGKGGVDQALKELEAIVQAAKPEPIRQAYDLNTRSHGYRDGYNQALEDYSRSLTALYGKETN